MCADAGYGAWSVPGELGAALCGGIAALIAPLWCAQALSQR